MLPDGFEITASVPAVDVCTHTADVATTAYGEETNL
jgi:hypothetical protein